MSINPGMRAMLSISLMVAIAVAAILAVIILMRQPQGDRAWSPPLAKVATFEEGAPSQYTLNNVRAFEYGPEGALRKEWETAEINARNLKEIWFFIEPFTGNPLFAHSFVSFVFENDDGEQQTLSISIEARKEAGEAYSPLRGAMRAYELLYVWSTEKDVLTRIAVKLDHPLYAYKLDLAQDRAAVLFDYFVKRTNDLAARPRFYNTLHSNCTNELAKAVNDAFPGALPWHRSWVMTGRSAKWLHKLGFIGEDGETFNEITARADIQPFVKTHAMAQADDFAERWRRGMEKNAPPETAQ